MEYLKEWHREQNQALFYLFERAVTLLAALFGACSAVFGYWRSFEASLPTGASMAGVSCLGFALVWPISQWLRRRSV